MPEQALPSVVLWEITYACPLRCTHCFSESGRRPSRQPPLETMLRIADKLVELRPRLVHLTGGEPLVIRDLVRVVERLRSGGADVVLTTSGVGLSEEVARGLAESCHSIHVSVDGPDAAVHDRIRARAGAFAEALSALALFDELSRARRSAGRAPLRFGIACVVLRDTFPLMRRLLQEVVPRFSELEFVIFNAVVPQGPASRESYGSELLDDEQLQLLADPELGESLRAVAPPGVFVELRDNLDVGMDPGMVAEGVHPTLDRLIVEPDGLVRALQIYEGQVGSLLEDPIEVIWNRILERRVHPTVVQTLAEARSSAERAAASRALDLAFASPDELLRIGRRKPYSRGA